MVKTHVDTSSFNDYMSKVKTGTRSTMRRVLNDLAKDAALLARAHEPHNMPRKNITWGMTDAYGPAVRAKGAPAGYSNGSVIQFWHPVFASSRIPRNKWNWAAQKHTTPFVEDAVEEVMSDSSLVISSELQKLFDSIGT